MYYESMTVAELRAEIAKLREKEGEVRSSLRSAETALANRLRIEAKELTKGLQADERKALLEALGVQDGISV